MPEPINADNVFESCVNPEGYKAWKSQQLFIALFESCVNPEGYKAPVIKLDLHIGFESCVNPEGYKARRLPNSTGDLV